MDTTPLTNKRKFVVGTKHFNNNVSALQYFSKNPKEKIYFDPGYDFINNYMLWRVEPPKSIYFYHRQHAKYIASQYDEIFLMYSGGTDSHTMLTAFLDEEIKNVKIISHNNGPQHELYKNHVINELFSKYKHKLEKLNYKVDTLGFYKKHGVSSYETYDDALKNGNFGDFELNIGTLFHWFDYLSEGCPIVCKQKKKSKKCIVVGREKPNLTLVDNNKTWAWQIQSSYSGDIYGKVLDDNIDLIDFYFSDAIPEIQIKLSWLKKNVLEKIILIENLPLTNDVINSLQSNASNYYTVINSAMGYAALNDYLSSNQTKKDMSYLNGTVPKAELSKGSSNLYARKIIAEEQRNKYGISQLLDEYRKEAIRGIRNDFLSADNRIPSIKSVAVSIAPVSTSQSKT